MSPEQQFEALAARREKTPMHELDAFFDALPDVSETFMIGVMDRKGETQALYFWLRRCRV